MKTLKHCIFTLAMIAAFLIPAAAFADISPQGTYNAGGIIEVPAYNDSELVGPYQTVYYRVNGVNDTDGDLLLSVFNDKGLSFALGNENELGEFVEYLDPRLINVDSSLEAEPEDSHIYIRYSNSAGVGKGYCYLKVTNNTGTPQAFIGSVTNVADHGAYTFGELEKTTFGKDASAVYHYHPHTDLEKNCLIMLNGEEFEECCLDYLLVDADGNALNINSVILYTPEYHPYSLNDADYEIYIQPSLSFSADGEGISAPTTSVPYKFGIMPQNLKDFTISNPPSYTYNGKAKYPTVTVKYGGIKLVYDEDYYITYSNNKNAGTAKAIIEGFDGLPKGSVTKTFKIKRAANSMKASAPASKTFKAKAVKKKAQTFKAISVSKAKGTVSFSVQYANAKSKKALSFNKKTRVLTVRKNTKKGTYKITITSTDSGGKNHLKKAVKKSIIVKIK